MRRQTLFRAVDRVRGDIHASGVMAFIDQASELLRSSSSAKERFTVPLNIFRDYSALVSAYGESEREVVKILGVDDLSDPAWWQSLYAEDPRTSIFDARFKLRLVNDFVPRILALLRQEGVEEVRQKSDRIRPELRGRDLLSVILVEDGPEHSKPERLVRLLNSVSLIYAAFAKLEGLSEDDLIVLACDSGSDKSFDLLGAATVVKNVKELLLEVWDRRILHRHRQVGAAMQLISESLTIIGKLQEQRGSGALSEVEFELIKGKLIDGTVGFLEVGAITEEMNAQVSHSPRELMRAQPPLLAGPPSTTPREEPAEDLAEDEQDGEEELSEEDVRRLKDLIRRAESKESGPKSRRRRKS